MEKIKGILYSLFFLLIPLLTVVAVFLVAGVIESVPYLDKDIQYNRLQNYNTSNSLTKLSYIRIYYEDYRIQYFYGTKDIGCDVYYKDTCLYYSEYLGDLGKIYVIRRDGKTVNELYDCTKSDYIDNHLKVEFDFSNVSLKTRWESIPFLLLNEKPDVVAEAKLPSDNNFRISFKMFELDLEFKNIEFNYSYSSSEQKNVDETLNIKGYVNNEPKNMVIILR